MKKFALIVTTASVLAFPLASVAETLAEIYDLALANDPQLKAAHAAFMAGKEARAIGLAGLLPKVSATAEYSETDADDDSSNFVAFLDGNATTVGTTDTDKTLYSLSVNQPIFDLSAWYDYQQGKVTGKQAKLQYLADQQDLITRVADAYFNVLRSSENLSSARAEQQAIGRQLEQTRQRYEVGLLPITDVHEAQAAFDDAQVNTLELRGALQIAFEGLEVLTGERHQQLAGLMANFPVSPPDASREDWVKLSLENNLQLRVSQLGRDAASENAAARKSEHLPKITGSYSYQDVDQDGSFNGLSGFGGPPIPVSSPSSLESEVQTISLRVSAPLFTGGLVSAQRRQAYQRFVESEEKVHQALRSTTQLARTNHLSVVTDAAKIKARQQAITSAESALEATRAGYDVGTRNIVDLLFAERNLHQAKRNYANARYDYIASSLELKRVAGQLSPDDIYQLNAWVDPSLVIAPSTEQ